MMTNLAKNADIQTDIKTNLMSHNHYLSCQLCFVILANPHRLDDFICMKPGKYPDLGKVYDLLHFVQAFYRTNIDNNNTKTQN